MPARKLSHELVAFTAKPACFDGERQWVEWQALALVAAATRRAPNRFGPCEDCQARYQARMIAEKRCARPWLDLALVARKDVE
jgi:hypothetical protein